MRACWLWLFWAPAGTGLWQSPIEHAAGLARTGGNTWTSITLHLQARFRHSDSILLWLRRNCSTACGATVLSFKRLPKDIHPLYVQRNPALLARVRRRQREALRDAAFLLEVRRQCDALPGVQRRSIRENLNARVARRRLVRQSAAAGSWDPFELGALTVLCCSLSRALRSPCSVAEA